MCVNKRNRNTCMKTFKEWLNEQEINESATVIRWVDALDFSGEGFTGTIPEKSKVIGMVAVENTQYPRLIYQIEDAQFTEFGKCFSLYSKKTDSYTVARIDMNTGKMCFIDSEHYIKTGKAKWQRKFSPKYITFRNDKKSIISRYSS